MSSEGLTIGCRWRNWLLHCWSASGVTVLSILARHAASEGISEVSVAIIKQAGFQKRPTVDPDVFHFVRSGPAGRKKT